MSGRLVTCISSFFLKTVSRNPSLDGYLYHILDCCRNEKWELKTCNLYFITSWLHQLSYRSSDKFLQDSHIIDRPIVIRWPRNEGVNGWKEKVIFQIVNLSYWLYCSNSFKDRLYFKWEGCLKLCSAVGLNRIDVLCLVLQKVFLSGSQGGNCCFISSFILYPFECRRGRFKIADCQWTYPQ